jgi:WD40 repeat protein/tRNA A-37 threonylcarbamoyl transferase component Bud32
MSATDDLARSPQLLIDLPAHAVQTREDSPTCILSINGTVRKTKAESQQLNWPHVPGYEILSEVGSGAMGVVYKALHRDLRRTVALKMLRGPALSDAFFRDRFRGEAAAVARLQHPNIIQVFEIGTAALMPGELAPGLFISLEFVGGGSLAQQINKPKTARTAAAIVEKLARATYYAHQAGVIHRDLKPANVLMGLDNEPKIADFGVAKQLGEDRDAPGRYSTMAGTLIGTPEYMSPEQMAGSSPSASMDIYSLGVILYELLTARVPFQGATSVETLDLVRHQEPLSPSSLHPELPDDLETICLKCLEKQPFHRYGTALELAEDLRRFLDDRPIRARRISDWERIRRWCRRNPALAATSAGTLCVFLLAFVLVTLSYWRVERALKEEGRLRLEAQLQEKAERWERYRANLGATAAAIQLHNVDSAARALEAAPEEYRNWEWAHFCSRLDSSKQVLRIAEPKANKGDVTPDGRWVFFAAPDGRSTIWNVLEQKPIFPPVHAPEFFNARLSDDGSTIVYKQDETLVIKRVNSDRTSWQLPNYRLPAYTAKFTADSSRLVTCSNDNSICVWDVRTGKLLAKPTLPRNIGGGLSISPDGRLASVTLQGVVDPVLVDLSGPARVRVLKGHASAVSDLVFNRQGNRLVSVELYPQLTVRLWDTCTGELLGSDRGHTNGILGLVFSPDGSRFATASMDQAIRFWDGSTCRHLVTLKGHDGWVKSIAFSPDGTRLVSGSQDRTVRLWDVAGGELLAILHGHTSEVFHVAFASSGDNIVSTSADGTTRVWDAHLVESNGVLRGHTGFVYQAVVHPDGERVASAAWDGTVRLWNLTTGKQLRVIDHAGEKIVAAVAFHPAGRLLASRDRKYVHVWDVDSGREVHRLAAPADLWRDTRLAFSPDGRLLATGGANCQIHLWNLDKGAELSVLLGHADQVRDLCFSPDGRWLASAGEKEDRTIRIWDVTTLTLVQTLTGHHDCVYSLAFARDGKWLASGSTDGTLRIWNTSSWEEEAALKLGSNVYGVAFTPDGSRVAGACADNVIRFCDTSTHQVVAELRGHHSYVHSIAFSADGKRLVSASGDMTVRIWDTLRMGDRLAAAL